MVRSGAKNAVILGAPLALVVFPLAHGVDWLLMHGMNDDNYDAFIQNIVDIRRRWLAVHLVGLFLFPRLGTSGSCRRALSISHIASLHVYRIIYRRTPNRNF
jgi:hypothetical protein